MTKSKDKSGIFAELIKDNSTQMTPYTTEIDAHLNPVDGIKAVLFDVYGTMLISGTGDIGISEEKNNLFPISKILESHNFKLISHRDSIDEKFSLLISQFIREEHQKYKIKGIQYPEVDIVDIWNRILTLLITENYISGSIEKDNIQKAAIIYECMVNPVWPMPGIDMMISYLYDKKYKLGIVSNAQFYTEEILKTLTCFEIEEHKFDRELLFYSYREKEAKPSKDFFLKAVTKIKKMYNIESEEILYIGNDMLNDIYTAAQCGCRTALFGGDKRSLRLRSSDSRCKELKPDLIITEMAQLKNIL